MKKKLISFLEEILLEQFEADLSNNSDKLEIIKKISKNKSEKMLEYMTRILEINREINMTSITDENEFILKNILDSLVLGREEGYLESEKILDLGTGAGFPGIPLAILNEDKKFYLLDATNKRLKVIKNIAEDLDISNIEIIHGRAEDIGKNKKYREKFDLVMSRAVANLSTLSELALPLVAEGGLFVAYKGPNISDEIEESEIAIETLGGSIDFVIDSRLEGLNHNLLFITKISQTPKKYPRKAGEPARKPIK